MTEEKKIGSEVFTEDMKTNEKLVLTVTSEFGQSLIKQSITDYQKKQQARVQSEVSLILERIETIETIRKRSELRLQLLRDQIQAIHDGKFLIREVVGYNQTKINFVEERLNVDWAETERW